MTNPANPEERRACLDPALNRAPEDLSPGASVHLIGICGTAMAALAGMLKEQGFAVAGSDADVYPPMSDFLAAQNIPVQEGFLAEHLHPEPRLVIVGNVVRAVNPEALELERLRLPYLSMPQALGHFFLADRTPLVVTGTHGKTTTSSLLAATLHRMGETPGFMIGGLVEAFGRNYNVSNGRFFVVEGDEYDTAFFNKVSKFHHYRPQYAICTSVEFDHADIFPDLAAVKATFAEFYGRIPEDGALVVNGDDPVIAELLAGTPGPRGPVLRYGEGEGCDWRLLAQRPEGLACEFAFTGPEGLSGTCRLPMPGRHNCLNALSVIALLSKLGFGLDRILPAVARFEGVKRRQQIRGVAGGVTVVDDFAHHPTAVRATLAALRAGWPGDRLTVVFEPRTNTSRRAVFQRDYAEVFGDADRVLIREITPLADVPPDRQFSSARLAEDLRNKGLDARSYPGTDAIIEDLAQTSRSGDKIIVLSNGGFDNIHTRLLERLEGPARPGA